MRLSDLLLGMDSESHWGPDDIRNPKDDGLVLSRFLTIILRVFQQQFAAIDGGGIYIAGFRAGYLSLKAATVSDLGMPNDIARINADFFPPDKEVFIINSRDSSRLGIEVKSLNGHLCIKLMSSGEYIGFVALVLRANCIFDDSSMKDVLDAVPALRRVVGDAVFSHRLRKLSSPLDLAGPINNEQQLFDEICKLALTGMAADGVVLRVYDKDTGELMSKAQEGDIRPGQLDAGSIAEQIARRVFESDKEFGTARTISTGRTSSGFGVTISEADEVEFSKLGVLAYMVIRLQSEISLEGTQSARIGTLAIFHLRPQQFSLRDISLFSSFCERVADDIYLFRQNQQLADNNLLLRAQGASLARAELAALLAHDLGNRGGAVGIAVDGFIERAQKALRERRNADSLNEEAAELKADVGQLKQQLINLKHLISEDDNDADIFDLDRVLDSVSTAISGALQRNRMTLRRSGMGNVKLNGPRDVLMHVFLNLAINSIEAQRDSKVRRENQLSIDARVETLGDRRTLVINVADQGPGVNPRFQDANEIFKLSVTTKKGGTGSGLPISRSLLDRFFGGSLTLQQRKPALFIIRIPLFQNSN